MIITIPWLKEHLSTKANEAKIAKAKCAKAKFATAKCAKLKLLGFNSLKPNLLKLNLLELRIERLQSLQNGAGFLSWANRFRNVVDQFRPFGREALKFLEGQSLEEVEKMAKSLGSGCEQLDAVSELYDEKCPNGK